MVSAVSAPGEAAVSRAAVPVLGAGDASEGGGCSDHESEHVACPGPDLDARVWSPKTGLDEEVW